MSNMRQIIEEHLQALEPEFFDFKGGGHYAIVVVSNAFENIGRLQRQRMIKQLLQDLFSDGLIHALSIKAATPDEYFH